MMRLELPMQRALHVPRDHCLAPERVDAPIGPGGRYGRMFDLPPLEADEQLLHELGAAGGFCDGSDDARDARVEAGWPFFGQYVAHDLTADRSPLRAHTDVAALRNVRSARANLESLYGGGPVGTPYLYRRDDPAKLLEHDGDLPRNQEGIALIGDPRNDVHVFMNQLQVAFIRAHDRLVDRLRADGVDEGELFAEARRALSWHYQWLILNDFLPSLVGSELVDELFETGPRFYRPDGEAFIPLEFADAAYRYGHSQIRQLYRLQPDGPLYAVFPDLIGFGAVGDHRVDWALLFDVPGPLWLYVLLESSVCHDGDRLGEVGGRIVAEVLYGVVAADPESYLAVDPGWTPTLPARGATFRLADLLVT